MRGMILRGSTSDGSQRRWLGPALGALPVLIVALCCALPVGWLAWQVLSHPKTWVELGMDRYRWELLGRTIAYNGSVAVLATILGLPAALVLGRGKPRTARLLGIILPICLVLPSLAYAYGWSQFVRLMQEPLGHLAHAGLWRERWGQLLGLTFVPGEAPRVILQIQGPADVFRCIWTLAAWLWPIPAGIVGLSLRQVDTQVQQAALLDGVLWRVTLRQLIGPLVASAAIVMVLAVQEFAVYEPTGISVVATEVRMVFETGAFSSPDNPIIAPMTGLSGGMLPATQAARAAAAAAVALPLLIVVFGLSGLALWGARRISAAEDLEIGPFPKALEIGWIPAILALLIIGLTLGVPTASLILSLKQKLIPAEAWETFSPQVIGSLEVAAAAGVIGAVVALLATMRRHPIALALAILAFLIGGQLLAIGLVCVYNRRSLDWIYNGPPVDWQYNVAPIVVIAYLARFVWLALWAGRTTQGRSWRQLRQLAAVDGAGPWATTWHVVWPLAWPICAAAGVFVMVLSLTEVPATVLLASPRPPMLIPLLMTWVHMLRYDDMIVASLLMMTLASGLGLIALALLGVAHLKIGRPTSRSALFLLCLLLLPGCSKSSAPEAIWCDTGVGPAQVVYPRAITYSPTDGTFFVVDRMARVQHLDARGKYLNEWRMPEHKMGKPVGISVGPDGNIYIPDTHYQRVCVYTPEGHLLRQWGSFGDGPGQFIYPTDVAFDAKGRIFVSEYGDHDRIQVFDAEGNYLYEFGKFGKGDGEFSRPQSMLIDGDLLYVTDACNHRINVFKTDGTFVRNMGQVGSGLGQFRFPYGLAQDREGHLVVCEFGNNRVQLLDKDTGRGLKTWGSAGREPGQLAYPWAVAVDKDNRVVAVDAGNNRLQVFEF